MRVATRLFTATYLFCISLSAQVFPSGGGISARSIQRDQWKSCEDAGGTDAYACNLLPVPTAYGNVSGGVLCGIFKANTANTGAASINFNSIGAKTIKKVAGGVTTDLASNDIRAGQMVDVCYDGTNMQMQSLLGNAPGGGGLGYVLHAVGGTSTSNWTAADATTYFIGLASGSAPPTAAATRKIWIPAAGTITAAYVNFYQKSNGTTETSTISIRLNDTTDTTISAVVINNAAFTTFSNAALSIAVVAGDFIELKWATPTWTTNPSLDVGAFIYVAP